MPENRPLIRQTSPAAARNQGPLLQALQALLPASGQMLEIAAGTGQHAAHFAAGLPGWTWLPTDPDTSALGSIEAWRRHQPAPGLRAPLQLDVLHQPWPVDADGAVWDGLYCANMLHIAPWACCGALMQGARRLLLPEGQLITYGPYRVQGEPTADSNEAFDADLRRRNPAWGLRWLHEIEAEAGLAGLALRQRLALPANNQVLVFARAPG